MYKYIQAFTVHGLLQKQFLTVSQEQFELIHEERKVFIALRV